MFRASKRRQEPTRHLPIQEFGIIAGRWQPRPANVRAVALSRARARQERGDLFVSIETPGQSTIDSALADELISAIADTYYGQAGSITRGLREAILVANELLYQRNMQADESQRVLAGITCAAVRDEDVYIGQLGPGLAMLVHQGQTTQYPSDSIWFHNATPSDFDLARQPMTGLRQNAQPELFLANLEDDDLLVLASTSLARQAGEQSLSACVLDARSSSVQQWLKGLAGDATVTGIAIGWSGEPSATTAEPVPVTNLAPAPEMAEPETVAEDDPPARALFDIGRLAERMAPAQDQPAAVDQRDAARDADLQDFEDVDYDDEELDDEPWDAQWQSFEEDIRPDTASTPARPRVDLGELRDNLSERANKVRENTESILAGVMPDRLPERPQVARDANRSISLSGRALVVVALALPLIMVLFVVMTRIQYQNNRDELLASIVSLAQARYDAGMRAEDPELKRQELYAALDKTNEGLALEPEHEILKPLERNILHRLDGVDTVTRIPHFWRLHTLTEDALMPTDSARIVIQDRTIYLLNRGSDKVHKFLLNEVGDALQSVTTDTQLIARGDELGGVQLGDLVDIAWLARGGQRSLDTFVTLERAGSMVAYDPQQGLDVLPVADSDTWLKPQAIGGYYGNLYVLDPLLGHILKYEPTDDAYTTSPTYYIDPQRNVDLTGAIDMTIDGNMYVLFANGTVKKFFNGQEAGFSMYGLPSPIENPVTIFVSGEQEPDAHGYVYVADAGNERILQFDKSGAYVRQFRGNADDNHMDSLQGLYVDETNQRMFLLNDNTLWLTNLESVGS